MKRRFKTTLSLLSLFALVGCGGNNTPTPTPTPADEINFDELSRTERNTELGNDEEAMVFTEPEGVTEYVRDDTDYDSLPMEQTSLIRIYYRQRGFKANYSNYHGWRIWAWDPSGGSGWWREFTKYDDFGVICDIPISEIAANGTSMSTIGTVFTTCASQTATWDGTYDKNPDCDVIGDVSPMNPGGIQRLYLRSDIPAYFPSAEAAYMSSIDHARYYKDNFLKIYFLTNNSHFEVYRRRLSIKDGDHEYDNFYIGDVNVYKTGASYQAIANVHFRSGFGLTSALDIEYRVNETTVAKAKSIISTYYDGEEFEQNYTYTGNDLGATFDNEANPSKTTFKVWSPVSKSMKLNIYESGDYRVSETPTTYEMTLGEKGVWSYTVENDLSGKYYTYTVTNSNGTNEVVDPYAKSAGLNGRRGMVVNFTKINSEIAGWANDVRPSFGEPEDASIYEAHVRDMTINPNSNVTLANRGKFLGLAETGTTYQYNGVTVSTGLDHIEELGITHLQLQPFYDYSSVDEATSGNEMSETNYNWGYDPQNYNVLEGSYSTNPVDGKVRIIEFKQMMMALHAKGINVIMDVVYNHTSSFSNSVFEILVPNYYHRTQNNGVAYNGSGCGNEMASERSMVNKYIRESCKFWLDEYHLGGYRFDLMGLMDNQVMIDIYNDCHSIYDKVLVFGEPWTGGTSKLKSGTNSSNLKGQQTVQNSLNQSYFAGSEVYVGAFSDGFRNSARGDNAPGKGFVNGIANQAAGLLPGIKGMFGNGTTNVDPQQVINYVSCHDNYTLYDQIIQTRTSSINESYSQAETLVFTAQGIPFMQEGEDFMRTKKQGENKYCENSYNVGDFVNNMDYELKAKNIDMFNYFKELIAMRKANPLFTLRTRTEINQKVLNVTTNAKYTITYNLVDNNTNLFVIHTASSDIMTLDGDYEVLLCNTSTFAKGSTISGSINIAGNTSLVLRAK